MQEDKNFPHGKIRYRRSKSVHEFLIHSGNQSIHSSLSLFSNPPDNKCKSFVVFRPESVNYVGYYSSHEQFMQQLILEQANVSKKFIEEMITQLSSHCRTHLLWTKLNTASSSVSICISNSKPFLSSFFQLILYTNKNVKSSRITQHCF